MTPIRQLLWTLTAATAFGLSLWTLWPGTVPPGAVATVNGTVLRDADLLLRLRPDHQREQPVQAQLPEYRRRVLETIVGEELAAQRAHQLELDSDPEYLAGLAPLQAQVDAYRRKALSELLAQHEVRVRGGVTDAEARRFFDENATRLKTQVQVWQILRRSEESIEQARRELAQAPSFEAYARSQFPQLGQGERPWDLGYLRWEQLPAEWRDVVYGLKKGDVSPVIRGQKDRFWILQVADVRVNPEVTFESIRPTLIEALKGKKLEGLREQTAAELRAKARVVYRQP